MRQLALYDELTGLPNRRLLLDRLRQSILASNRTGIHGAVMFLDLDNLKLLNDTHGHEVGDWLLAEVARRLVESIRKEDTVARLGGDEFIVMLDGLHADKAQAIAIATSLAEKIRATLARPYSLHPPGSEVIEHRCTGSIGITLFSHEANPEEILRNADAAMYQAKTGGRNAIRFFDQTGADT